MDNGGIEMGLTPTPPPKVPVPDDFKPVKYRRRIRRDKHIRTITLFERDLDSPNGRKESKIPANVDAARVLTILTAEKLRAVVEKNLEKADELSPKDLRELSETLERCNTMVITSIDPPNGNGAPRPAQSLIVKDSTIVNNTGDPIGVTSMLQAMASAGARKEPVNVTPPP